MGKPTICMGENKDADQLRGNRQADQPLCFRYSDSTIPLLLISEISSILLFSVLAQAGLCLTCSEENTLLVFPRGGSFLTRSGKIKAGKPQRNGEAHNSEHQENMSVKCVPSQTPLLFSKTGVFRGIPIFLFLFCSKI